MSARTEALFLTMSLILLIDSVNCASRRDQEEIVVTGELRAVRPAYAAGEPRMLVLRLTSKEELNLLLDLSTCELVIRHDGSESTRTLTPPAPGWLPRQHTSYATVRFPGSKWIPFDTTVWSDLGSPAWTEHCALPGRYEVRIAGRLHDSTNARTVPFESQWTSFQVSNASPEDGRACEILAESLGTQVFWPLSYPRYSQAGLRAILQRAPDSRYATLARATLLGGHAKRRDVLPEQRTGFQDRIGNTEANPTSSPSDPEMHELLDQVIARLPVRPEPFPRVEQILELQEAVRAATRKEEWGAVVKLLPELDRKCQTYLLAFKQLGAPDGVGQLILGSYAEDRIAEIIRVGPSSQHWSSSLESAFDVAIAGFGSAEADARVLGWIPHTSMAYRALEVSRQASSSLSRARR